jgi:Iap family predicted aminopeptidase
MKSHYIIEGDVVNLVGAKKSYSRLFYGTEEQAKNEVYKDGVMYQKHGFTDISVKSYRVTGMEYVEKYEYKGG